MNQLFFTIGLALLSSLAFFVYESAYNNGEQNYRDILLWSSQNNPEVGYEQRRGTYEESVHHFVEGLIVLNSDCIKMEPPVDLSRARQLKKINSIYNKLVWVEIVKFICDVTSTEFFAVLNFFQYHKSLILEVAAVKLSSFTDFHFPIEHGLNPYELRLKNTRITVENLLWFFRVFPHLKRLTLDENTVLAKKLFENDNIPVPHTINSFSCQNCELTLAHFMSIFDTFPNHSPLKLDLRNNPSIGNDLKISDAPRTNLKLWGLNLNSCDIDSNGFKTLTQMFSSLRYLSVNNNNIGDGFKRMENSEIIEMK